MRILIIQTFFLFIIFHFYCNYIEANEEFKFIDDQFESCKRLENGRKNFEQLKNNADYEWDKIEPKNELKKCILHFDVAEYLHEIEKKFTIHQIKSRSLNYLKEEQNESEELRIFSAKLEKLHLNKELMKMLQAKIGGGIQATNEGIIQISDSADDNQQSKRGKGKEPQNTDVEITQISDSEQQEDQQRTHHHRKGKEIKNSDEIIEISDSSEDGSPQDGKGRQRIKGAFSHSSVVQQQQQDPLSHSSIAHFNWQIEELIKAHEGSSSNHDVIESSGNIKRGGKHDLQIHAETNIGRLQILQSIYGFRKRLNTEIKWLNMMLWLKKSKAYMEKIEQRLANENEKQTAELLENFQIKLLSLTNSYWIMENFNKLRKKLENIKKESDNLKAEQDKDKIELTGNLAAEMSTNGKRNDWPHYDELLAKTNFMIKLDFIKDSRSMMNKKEEKQINKLQKFVENWNNKVVKVRSKINELIRELEYPNIRKQYEEIYPCVVLHRVTSMTFQLLMGVFEWENVEWKMAAIRHLANVMEHFITILAESKKQGQMNELKWVLKAKFNIQEWKTTNPLDLIGNSKLIDDDQTLFESRDIQIRVIIDALRVLTFYEKLNGKIIRETTGANDDKKIEELWKFKNEINKLMKKKLPEDKNRLEIEYWKWYEEYANKKLKNK